MAIAFHFFSHPTDVSLYSQQQKRDLKHYVRGVSLHLFPARTAQRLYNPEFITKDESTEHFHIFLTVLIVLPTPSLHIEMITYCTSYTNNRKCLIAYKYTDIKICYKNYKFAFEGNKSKVVRSTVLT